MAIRLVRPVPAGVDYDDEPTLVNPPDEVELALLQLRMAKHAEADAKLAIVQLEERLIDLLGDQKTVRRGGMQATVVRRETTRIDEDSLKKKLGAPLFNKATKRVLDKAKLESLISLGEVTVEQVASASQLVPSKPYVRVSEVVEAEDS